jgi:hypothetical protein
VDVATASKVAVLGSVVHEQLFGAIRSGRAGDRINNQPFTVVGVMASKGQSGMGQDQDDVVYVPYTTVMKKLRGITYYPEHTGVGDIGSGHDPDCGSHRDAAASAHQIVDGNDDFMVPHHGGNGERAGAGH